MPAQFQKRAQCLVSVQDLRAPRTPETYPIFPRRFIKRRQLAYRVGQRENKKPRRGARRVAMRPLMFVRLASQKKYKRGQPKTLVDINFFTARIIMSNGQRNMRRQPEQT